MKNSAAVTSSAVLRNRNIAVAKTSSTSRKTILAINCWASNTITSSTLCFLIGQKHHHFDLNASTYRCTRIDGQTSHASLAVSHLGSFRISYRNVLMIRSQNRHTQEPHRRGVNRMERSIIVCCARNPRINRGPKYSISQDPLASREACIISQREKKI